MSLLDAAKRAVTGAYRDATGSKGAEYSFPAATIDGHLCHVALYHDKIVYKRNERYRDWLLRAGDHPIAGVFGGRENFEKIITRPRFNTIDINKGFPFYRFTMLLTMGVRLQFEVLPTQVKPLRDYIEKHYKYQTL